MSAEEASLASVRQIVHEHRRAAAIANLRRDENLARLRSQTARRAAILRQIHAIYADQGEREAYVFVTLLDKYDDANQVVEGSLALITGLYPVLSIEEIAGEVVS